MKTGPYGFPLGRSMSPSTYNFPLGIDPTLRQPPVSGYSMWFDSADASSLTVSGGTISEWRDKSGNDHNLIQPTGSNQPTYGSRTINNIYVPDFDGSNDFMYNFSFIPKPPISLFFVAVNDTASGFAALFSGSGNALESHRNGTNLGVLRNSDGSSLGSTVPVTQSAVSVYQYLVSTSVCDLRGDDNGSINGHGVNLDSVTGSFYICNRPAGLIWDGAVAECVVYSSVLDRQAASLVFNYLREKWGTP